MTTNVIADNSPILDQVGTALGTLDSTTTIATDMGHAALEALGRIVKRAIDLFGAATGLLLLAPVMITVALLVKLTDPTGPVLYQQKRLGQGGRSIGVFKFRSMLWEYSTGAERQYKTAQEAFVAMGREDLIAEFELTQKVADDPRVSPLGAFLRKSSLDELPQLFNALRGELSLVGPRPIIPVELERYGAHAETFLTAKPGITGLWQVSGRSDVSYDERVQLDVRYVSTWSVVLDIAILFRTVAMVVAQRGAV